MNAPLRRIIIFVGDVKRCAEFYRDAFGFTIIAGDHPESEWLELETGGCDSRFIRRPARMVRSILQLEAR
jgi:hypothetical protein